VKHTPFYYCKLFLGHKQVFFENIKENKIIFMHVDFFLISASIGCIVFLIQKTDFISEYLKLLLIFLKKEKYINLLKITHYEKSNLSGNYVEFLASVYGVKNNLLGFALRLASCFFCLTCFTSLWVNIFFGKLILIFPMFFFAVLTYHILWYIMQKIYYSER
jgi:hypothetical protein